jgi:hypothetical protein
VGAGAATAGRPETQLAVPAGEVVREREAKVAEVWAVKVAMPVMPVMPEWAASCRAVGEGWAALLHGEVQRAAEWVAQGEVRVVGPAVLPVA